VNLFRPFQNPSPIASPAAFSALYERNRLPVFRYIYGLTGGPQDDVEDLTAETFMRAWKARQHFDGEADAATGWLIRIARRLVIDDYRRRKARPVGKPDEAGSAAATPEQNALDSEQQQRLLALLAELTDEQREMLVLRYWLGWRVSAVAAQLGMTENNVSVTIHRTLARLRQSWTQSQEN
jgi:RNA polymerase sigma-70 factor (ECF subfamily)